jgi:LacI family transcriptional regulator
MKTASRPAVALLVEASRAYGRELLRGVARYSRTHTNWSLLHQEMTLDSGIPDLILANKISGVITRVDSHNADQLRQLNVPIVDVRCTDKFAGVPQVDTDSQRITELAFSHLWDRGFRRFAFCGYQFASYSELRRDFFRDLVAQAGCPLSIYESEGNASVSLTRIEQLGMVDVEPMSNWLQSLEPPTGLFVCNDIRGQQVLNACRTLEIAVPDDVGVIGVDDDEAICLLCDPPLSSVRPDADKVGFRAAELLHELMSGRPVTETTELIQPTSVSQRLSTQVVAVEDRELARVCRFIRQHACEGINVKDVAEFTSLSRRQLERRFREELQRTPHEEITAIQVAKVKQLLCESDMTLEQITPIAGYSHKERLSAVFKRETGQAPGAFRRESKTNSQ